MKRLGKFVLLFGIFVILGLVAINPAWGARGSAALEPAAQAANQVGSGMPGWPMPDKPIPHHEPGHPSKAGQYTSQVEVIGETGLSEIVQVSGVEALAADGIDPFAGNYTLVGMDKFLRSSRIPGDTDYGLETLGIVSPTIDVIPGSLNNFGDYSANDIAAGDLNNDGQAEQILAWLDDDSTVRISTGEMPGSFGKTTSAPAAVAVTVGITETIQLLVRGYDQALWHCLYDVNAKSCVWENEGGGGVLLSAPAVISQAPGEFDVYAILADNLVYRRTWNGAWSGDWTPVEDDTAYWQPLESMVPVPELPAPAVVARGGLIDLFRLGPDNTLRWRHYDGSWQDWQNLGGFLASDPAALSLGADQMQVFAYGADNVLWTRIYNAGWGNWQRVTLDGMVEGVSPASTLAAVSPAAGQIDLYVRGSDDQLWKVHYNGSTWGDWSNGGGTLASAVWVAVLGSEPYLFSQTYAGGLQVYRATDPVWASLAQGLPPCCTVFDTGLIGLKRDIGIFKDFSVDIETGYFWGDGRSQTVLGYFSPAGKVTIALFDTSLERQEVGFTPNQIISATLETNASFFRIATGDFLDRDGIDDIAVVWIHEDELERQQYTVEIWRFDRDSGNFSNEVSYTTPFEDERSFSGTLEIAPGDFDGDGLDEFVVSSSWEKDDDYLRFKFRMHIFDVDWEYGDIGPDYVLNLYYTELSKNLDGNEDASGYSVSITLAAGDVDGDGRDEIVRTWPYWMAGLESDRFIRKLEVIQLPKNSDWKKNDWGDGVSGQIDGYTSTDLRTTGETQYSYGDRLAVGNSFRDTGNEIIYQEATGITSSPYQTLRAYQVKGDGYEEIASRDELFHYKTRLVSGDFLGEGLRVGPPTYRFQDRIDSFLAQLNMPPKHWDMIKQADGSYETIEILTEECWTSPYDPKCTHTLHGTILGDQSSTTIETKANSATAEGEELKISDLVLLENSMEETFGENFSYLGQTTHTTTYSEDTTAGYDDAIIYYRNSYHIWEYPLYIDSTTEPASYITVMFPIDAQTNKPDAGAGAVCQESWYNPEHQPYNVWSYDPIGSISFSDYLTSNLLLEKSIEGSESDFKVVFDDDEIGRNVSSQWHEINDEHGSGAEYNISAGINIKMFSYEANYENRYKAYTKSSYNWETHITEETHTSEATFFSAYFASVPPADIFETKAVAYWSNTGPLVIDFQTNPGTGTTWQMYNKPDPAFILPWYGYPDPDNLPYPDDNNHGAPPCGSEKQYFSRDILVQPLLASVGDTVVISATVRNFSNEPIDQLVTVRFYQGVPGNDNDIGDCTIYPFNRADGPQSCAIPWMVVGEGEQKIYAVIDPDHEIIEMHDEDHIINNNMGYGLLQIGAASYVDMGVAEEQPYEPIRYEQSNTLSVALYVPSANLNATTRLDVFDVPGANVSGIGNPFEVVARQGTVDRTWDVPIKDFWLRPDEGDPPAVVTIAYADADIAGYDESLLQLYRLDGAVWVEATCPGYELIRFPEDNRLAVPICQTGTFVLSDDTPEPIWIEIFLPSILR